VFRVVRLQLVRKPFRMFGFVAEYKIKRNAKYLWGNDIVPPPTNLHSPLHLKPLAYRYRVVQKLPAGAGVSDSSC